MTLQGFAIVGFSICFGGGVTEFSQSLSSKSPLLRIGIRSQSIIMSCIVPDQDCPILESDLFAWSSVNSTGHASCLNSCCSSSLLQLFRQPRQDAPGLSTSLMSTTTIRYLCDLSLTPGIIELLEPSTLITKVDDEGVPKPTVRSASDFNYLSRTLCWYQLPDRRGHRM
jgi:hypothetical protein